MESCFCHVLAECVLGPTSRSCPWPHLRAVHSCGLFDSSTAAYQHWSRRPELSVCYVFCPANLHCRSVRFSAVPMRSLSFLICRVPFCSACLRCQATGYFTVICCACLRRRSHVSELGLHTSFQSPNKFHYSILCPLVCFWVLTLCSQDRTD